MVTYSFQMPSGNIPPTGFAFAVLPNHFPELQDPLYLIVNRVISSSQRGTNGRGREAIGTGSWIQMTLV